MITSEHGVPGCEEWVPHNRVTGEGGYMRYTRMTRHVLVDLAGRPLIASPKMSAELQTKLPRQHGTFGSGGL